LVQDFNLRTPDYQKCYFQQDGASPHIAALVVTWLTERFGEKLIAKNEWSPRSPDLNPCDYFLWGYLKQRVYNPLPKTLEDLRSNLSREIENIQAQMLKDTFFDFRKKCELLISVGGGHI
jgi:hypothetical protein